MCCRLTKLGCWELKTASIVIGVLYLLGGIALTGLGAYGVSQDVTRNNTNGKERISPHGTVLGAGVPAAVFALLLLLGISQKNVCLLMAWVIHCVVSIVCNLGALASLIYVFTEVEKEDNQDDKTVALIACVGTLLVLLLQILGFAAVNSYRLDLKEEQQNVGSQHQNMA